MSLLRSPLLAGPVVALGLVCCGSPPDAPAAPALDVSCADCSLLLVSIDTLRADHLGCYGYARDTSPNIDALARQGTLFERAYATSYHTAESHMSVFTSLNPSAHGVRNATEPSQGRRLPDSARTMTEVMRAGGLATAGFHAGGNVSPPYGFGRGFDEYRYTDSDVAPAVEWLGRQAARPDQRFFLFFHTYRVHDPYLPPPPLNRLWEPDYDGSVIDDAEAFASLVGPDGSFAEKRKVFWGRVDPQRPEDLRKVMALYDGEIRQVDADVEALLAAVAELPQRVVVVLMSDHGEEFQEHGRFLHDQLYEPLLHVPLLVRHPEGVGAGQRVEAPVSLLGLGPTLLEILALPPLQAAQGESLVPHLERRAGTRPGAIYSEKVLTTAEGSSEPGALRRAVRQARWKLIRYASGERELYDTVADPGENRDLATAEPERVRNLEALSDRISQENERIRKLLAAGETSGEGLDAETVEQLRALGYLE